MTLPTPEEFKVIKAKSEADNKLKYEIEAANRAVEALKLIKAALLGGCNVVRLEGLVYNSLAFEALQALLKPQKWQIERTYMEQWYRIVPLE